jgi:thiol-disulfide isomerase/thioredoxin
MKYLFCILVFGLFTTNSSAQKIPAVKITEVKKLIDTATTPLVINFWASWCAPCIHEIPWFEKTVADYKKQGVKLILVSLDFKEDYPTRLSAFVKKKGYTSSILWLDETDADVFCTAIDSSWQGAIPVTLMINNKKKYRAFYPLQITEAQLKIALNKLIE